MIGAGVIFLVVIILVLSGNFPGLKTDRTPAELNFWGIHDPERNYKSAIDDFKEIYPNVNIIYRNFTDEETYERELFRAFAAGGGPDIFMVHNSSLDKNFNFVRPTPQDRFSLINLRQLFPSIVERDFVRNFSVYALPMSLDTLILIYNGNILSQAGVVFPPKNWEEFQEAVSKITRIDNNNNITRAGASLGGVKENIPAAVDILNALMMQAGVSMRSNQSTSFYTREGINAFEFYTQFSNPDKTVYTWNEGMPNARELFAQEKLGMLIDYGHAIPEIRSRNRFINLGVHRFPQQTEDISMAYASYWGLTVSRQSRQADIAWNFIIFITTNRKTTGDYVNISGRPPASREIIQLVMNHPEMDTLARQALVAKSWNQGDGLRVEKIFNQAIRDVIQKNKSLSEALNVARFEIANILREY